MEAWREVSSEDSCRENLTLVHYFFDGVDDIMVVLELLDFVRDGAFQFVLVVPPVSTWVKSRQLLRTRETPFGVPGVSPHCQNELAADNSALEVSTWFVSQALQCRVRKVAVLLSLPEAHGGHDQTGPASPWDLREVRTLGSLSEARRGSGYLCRLAQAEQQCPLGFLYNLPVLSKSLFPGWPQFSTADNYLQYLGPLPKSCGCPVSHRPLSGGSCDQSLNPLHSPSLGRNFWSIFFRAAISVTAGEDQTAALPSAQYISPVHSLSSLPSSLSSLYSFWCSGSLSPSLLQEHTDPESAVKFITIASAHVCSPSGRSGLADKCRFTSSCSVSKSTSAPTATSRASGSASGSRKVFLAADRPHDSVIPVPSTVVSRIVGRSALGPSASPPGERAAGTGAFLVFPLLFLLCRRLESVRLLVVCSRLECADVWLAFRSWEWYFAFGEQLFFVYCRFWSWSFESFLRLPSCSPSRARSTKNSSSASSVRR